MRGRGIVVRPPRRPIEPAQRWALARAFWPVDRQPSFAAGPADRSSALQVLRLESRVSSRVPSDLLVEELGSEGARRLLEQRRAAAARSLLLRRSATEVLAVARSLGMSPILLKFVALDAHRVLAEGGRAASDVDLLLAPREARALREELLSRGWEEVDAREEEHHLAAVCRPGSAPIELHTKVLGVRLTDGSVDAETLEEEGLLESADAGYPGARVPDATVLVAHLLVHGFAQHAASPKAYPLLQPLADVLDLGWPGQRALPTGVGTSERGWPAVDRIGPWIDDALGDALVDAAARLCERLSTADPTLLEETSEDSAEAALLAHCVWGMADDGYAQSLRLSAMTSPVTDASTWRSAARDVGRALWPTAGELGRIYGGRPGWLRRLWLRALRPLDLLRRTIRAGVRRAQVKRR